VLPHPSKGLACKASRRLHDATRGNLGYLPMAGVTIVGLCLVQLAGRVERQRVS